ncbi:MAG: SDR family NAD(P)-dependent oxidoreductase [Bryobacteraceae bacterium]|jgi:short-subunit dehydrogenase
MQIRDKVVLVTGASQGIGAATAVALAKRGARLAVTARSEEGLRSLNAPGAFVVPGDLLEPSDRHRVIENTLAHYGRIDILINNAGIGLYAPAYEAPMDQVRSMFELNFFAVLEMSQLAGAAMRERRSGAIVNVSSIAGKVTLPWFTLYSASKYAVCSLTDGLRTELRPFGVHAMAVCPGYVRTEFQAHVLAGRAPDALAGARDRFAITPAQCAEAIARGVERNARTVLTPRAGWLLVAGARLLPRLVDAQLERTYRRNPGSANK